MIRDGNIAAIGDAARIAAAGRRDDRRSDGQERHPRARHAPRAPLLHDRPRRVRPARRQLLAPLSRGRRDDDADGGERERDHGHQRRRGGSPPARCPVRPSIATAPYVNGPNTFLQMHAVESAEPGAHPRRLLAEQGATSLKAYMQISRASLKGAIDEGAQARDEDHRPSVFGDLRRGGRSRHRQPRARVLRRDGFRRRQAARRLSRAGARPADDRRARRERRAVQGAREEARGQARRADVDADRVRDVHARAPAAAGARRADAAAEGRASSAPTSARRRTRSRSTRRCSRRRCGSSARS